MVAVTYGVAPTADSKTVGKTKSFFRMLFDAVADAQLKRAEREIARYHYLRAPLRNENEDEPFGGW
jgi:hypothetical protein